MRRGSSLVRTLVVAASTLAILLVCFSMYQYSQMSPETARRPHRLPPTPTEPPPPPTATTSAANQPGVPFGQGVIGSGQNITVTIYPRQGTQAQMELSVRDWVPRSGSDHEFLLTEPEIRLRTKSGNNVRVTAREGVLDAQRKPGGGLDPRRGQLDGDVVIEFDRRTDKDKASLPAEVRDAIDPAELVRIAADHIEFDLEYSKLSVPGRIQVQARDVELEADDLELRFNEAQGRVESLRISRGGRIELADLGGQLAVKIPASQRDAVRRTTLVDWLRQTLEQKVAAANVASTATPAPAKPALANEENLPVIRGDEKVKEPKTEALYFAKFEGDVDAKHVVGGATQSRLQADALEVLRAFTELEKQKADAPPEKNKDGSTVKKAIEPEPSDRIVLEWSGRLMVNALGEDDPRSTEGTRARISAIGEPARLGHPEGEVLCRRLDYEPDNGLIRLQGAEESPVAVRSATQGAMTGRAAVVQRKGDALTINVTGPGTLSEAGAGSDRIIEFGERLDADGRFLNRTVIDFMGGLSTRSMRVLDRAAFSGRVRIVEGNTSLEADTLDTTFGEATSRGERPVLSGVTGRGHVVMVQGEDRITCDAIDVAFAPDASGATRPKSAVAKGAITAVQGERTMRAGESLTADFEPVVSDPGSTDAARVAVRRIRAAGEVTIQDPTQGLDVNARELECTVSDRREIEKAVLLGDADRPAGAKMDALTVTGQRINLDVANQWAEVPGAGRLSFLSKKDLDGQKLAKPLPMIITWSEQMKFHGRENRALFDGNVHATGESTTTFDCKQLLIEFVDVVADRSADWNLLQPIVNTVAPKPDGPKSALGKTRFSKEPVYLLADGDAVAETADVEADTGVMLSRSRISGPRLSVNLRAEASRMLIEGPGNLQLEDFRPPNPKTQAAEAKRSDLFQVGEDAGASKTLIEWRERMWYDFSIAQTRFEGKVSLKHLSGAELEKLFELSSTKPTTAGRATFLNCDVLTIDFVDRDARVTDAGGKRAARLSGDRLRQFQASGAVTLQDQVEGLTVAADNLVYERPRQLLAISGAKQRKAQITLRKPGQMPQQVAMERLFYNLATGKLELVQTTIKGQ